jgi:outer membrane protein OmpA-like peptidoglycan-associated protein/tetratricopeptide (TPR) repeat protein
MKKYLALLCCFAANLHLVQAQTPQQYLALATEAQARHNYAEAAEAYKIVLEDEAYAKNEPILWATAENCRLSNSPKQALLYYKRIKKTADFENYNQNVALMYKQLGDYTKATEFLNKITEPSASIVLEKAGCTANKTPNTDKWQVKYINDRKLNSDVADYYGFVYKKNVYFTSNRTTTNIGDTPLNVAALYFKKEDKTENLREADLDKKMGFVNVCLANDGKWLVFAEVKYDAATHHWNSNLRFIPKNGANIEENNTETPQKLQDSLFENATMPHWATEQNRSFLYFVSDRSGGKGGMDIWRSEYDNGTFLQPENMMINTAADDITPFYHAARQTLYFSSKGLASQGGFDVYAATNYTYSEPKITLLPAPLNSSFDDFYFGFAETDSTGYLSSTRSPKMLKGENGLCCADIFSFKKKYTPPVQPPLADNPPPAKRSFKPTPPTTTDSLPTPQIPTKLEPPIEKDTLPSIVKIDTTTTVIPPPTMTDTPPVVVTAPPPPPVIVTPQPPVQSPPVAQKTIQVPPTTSESTSITLYFHNDEPDPNTVKTTTSESYDQTYYRYIAMRRLYVKEYVKGAKADDKAMATEQINAFFDQSVVANFERLEATMAQIKARLERGETVRIHISGHCSPRAASDYNIKLSKRRIVCMQNYMQRWLNRSLATYIKSKKLIIEQSPFGEKTAPKNISDKYQDKRNSIFSPEASAERRVTVTVE